MKGKLLDNLEQFDVTKNGKKVQSVDRNYWGVTFGSDSNTFYATLSTGGKTYLIKGSLRDHSAQVIHDAVECPAVSPDGTRIAYKHREGGQIVSGVSQAVRWRLHVLDLQTGKDVELAETRSVDDQPMWFDNKTVGYAIPHAATGTAATDIYRVPADGSGKPKLVVASGWSPTLVP
jgi:Tol biopolymer transport system component